MAPYVLMGSVMPLVDLPRTARIALTAIALAMAPALACNDASNDSPQLGRDPGGAAGGVTPGGAAGSPAPSPGDAPDASSNVDLTQLATLHFLVRTAKGGGGGPSSVQFSWSGTQVRTRFSGTGATLHLHDTGTNQFDVSIDGAAPTLLKTSAATDDYVVARGLADAEHDVIVTKRTEALVGAVALLGLTSTEGRPLVVTAAPAFSRRIEIVGDSITAGYGVLGADASCAFSADTENEQLAYGALTAAALHAEHTAIAYSGIGVLRDYNGSTAEQMPVRYSRTLADDASSTWDFSYVPDVVVVNLGTNDFATGDPGAPFTTAYTDFLALLRLKYPTARIVAALSPMLSDTFPVGMQTRTIARGYLQAAVGARNATGDGKVTFLELDEQSPADGYGCDSHPSVTTHQKMSEKLSAALRGLMGW